MLLPTAECFDFEPDHVMHLLIGSILCLHVHDCLFGNGICCMTHRVNCLSTPMVIALHLASVLSAQHSALSLCSCAQYSASALPCQHAPSTSGVRAQYAHSMLCHYNAPGCVSDGPYTALGGCGDSA